MTRGRHAVHGAPKHLDDGSHPNPPFAPDCFAAAPPVASRAAKISFKDGSCLPAKDLPTKICPPRFVPVGSIYRALAPCSDAFSPREPVTTPHQVRGRLSLENALASCLSMISAQTLRVCREENRYPLFRIMR